MQVVKVVLLDLDYISKIVLYDKFLDKLSNRANKIKIGAPMDPETEMGPVKF